MQSFWWYLAQCLSAYVFVGIAVYFLDHKVIVPVTTWFRNLWYTNPIPRSREFGLLYNHKTQWRVTVAFVISTAQSAYMIWTGGVAWWIELPMWLLEVPMMLLGFILGFPLHQAYLRRKVVYDTVDAFAQRAEKVDVDQLGKDTSDAIRRAPNQLKAFARDLGTTLKAFAIDLGSLLRRRKTADAPMPIAPQVVAASASAVAAPVAPEAPMDVIKRFTGGR
jgi:hypothetical protein